MALNVICLSLQHLLRLPLPLMFSSFTAYLVWISFYFICLRIYKLSEFVNWYLSPSWKILSNCLPVCLLCPILSSPSKTPITHVLIFLTPSPRTFNLFSTFFTYLSLCYILNNFYHKSFSCLSFRLYLIWNFHFSYCNFSKSFICFFFKSALVTFIAAYFLQICLSLPFISWNIVSIIVSHNFNIWSLYWFVFTVNSC